MSKKILVISSSPRRGGNTDMLCDEFAAGAEAAGHQVEKIFLGDMEIGYCTGCSICSLHGKPCPQNDDAAEIIDKMIAADVIVLATPVYFYSMSAQMKTLIDRCCGKYTAMGGKEWYYIAAGAEGESGRRDLERAFASMDGFLDCIGSYELRGRILACGVWHKGEIKGHPAMAEAYEAGRNV